MSTCEKYGDYMLALAVGDVYGRPYEIAKAKPLDNWTVFDEKQLQGIEVAGRYAYSDDTETMLIMAESIIEGCGFNPYIFARRLAAMADIENPVRGYGTAVTVVVIRLKDGVPWWVSARQLYGGQGSMGNGALPRSLPITLFYHGTSSLEAMAVSQALVTHTNPVAVEGARLLAIIYNGLLEGLSLEEAVEKTINNTFLDVYRSLLRKALELKNAGPRDVARVIGNSAVASETLAAAVHVALKSGGNPYLALSYSISLGGDVDTIAAIAVSLSAMESNSISEIEGLARMVEAAETITDTGRRLCLARKKCWSGLSYI